MNLVDIARSMIRFLPDGMRYAVVRKLAARSTRPEVTEHQRIALMCFERIYFGKQPQKSAWACGEGPLVLLVHGWSGRAAQMAPLALAIAEKGYRCVAIDVTGHGASPGNAIEWRYFFDDLAEFVNVSDTKVYAFVGHSAGGLAMMAARASRGLVAQKYVCICAPSHPYPPINVVRKKLDPGESVLNRYKKYIAEQFQSDWAQLYGGLAFAQASSNLLLIYDEDDRFVEHQEGDRVLGLCPGARLIKSKGQGHVGILDSEITRTEIGIFLRQDA